VLMGHTSGALAPRNSAGCVRRRLDVIFRFTFDLEWSDPTPRYCTKVGPLDGVQVKSSQVKGAHRWRERWIAPSRGIIPIFLLLIIAAPLARPLGFNIVPFSGSRYFSPTSSPRARMSGAFMTCHL
jgi:hypothetical protein